MLRALRIVMAAALFVGFNLFFLGFAEGLGFLARMQFVPACLAFDGAALGAAAMIHAGATVIDSLPHGSFFHATGGAAFMDIRSRLRLIPFEAAIGLSATIAAVAVYLFRN